MLGKLNKVSHISSLPYAPNFLRNIYITNLQKGGKRTRKIKIKNEKEVERIVGPLIIIIINLFFTTFP